ncbi:aminopeptidase P family protein [Dehalogenimonas sp. THU2]|uniref:M24 family metallopeptidase n=1 Tax=Dehalogenimonas sp. THU2 TaxID=3151121 RepID=UPI0032184461
MMIDYIARLNLLRNKFPELGIDGILVAQPENRRYLSGFDGSSGYVLVTADVAVLATDFRYVEQAEIQAENYKVTRIDGPVKEWFPGLLREFNLKRLGLEAGFVTIADHDGFQAAISEAGLIIDLVPVEDVVEALRMVKNETEIRSIEAAASLTDRALFHVMEHFIKPGMTESKVAWELEKYIREAGGELAFPTIVAGGPASARPHSQPSDRPLRDNEPIVIDMGAKLDGYCADLTRTFWLGLDQSDRFRPLYDIVLRAQQTAIEGIVAGMTGVEADKLARDVIVEAGYGEAFGHSLGHGIGLEVHELPRLSARAPGPLTEGMVFTIEPGIYIPGWGGIRIEDDAVLEYDKIRLLTAFPK